MTVTTITPMGPFSLAASMRFLEGFTPAAYRPADPGEPLRLAFPADDGRALAGAAIGQGADGEIRVEIGGDADAGAVRRQVARILSLDVDGAGFPDAIDDPVARDLVRRHPGLRPVCFHSPYEAAVWAVISQRTRKAQAARIKADIADRHGEPIMVAGAAVQAFPAPDRLRRLAAPHDARLAPGLTDVKTRRLHAIAEAALDGDELDADRLRSMPPDEALERLRALPGIGPFSAELILIRGAGHPDVFPSQERRLHAAMAASYDLDRPDPGVLSEIAERWAPYRSWTAFHFRTHGDRTSAKHTPRAAG